MGQRKETTGAAQPELSFEQALEKLEALVRRMEGGEMGLDEMVGAFEQGQQLIQLCSRRLNEVERRIELLVKSPDGTLRSEPFETPER